jgi:DNA-directed RNA polymerase specialized sigma24 family protein
METRDRLDRFGKDALPALRAGHKRTWDSFVAAAVPLVSAVVDRVLSAGGVDDDAATDAVQTVFARLCANDFQMLRNYDPTRANISTWLAVLTRSSALDHIRRQVVVPLDDASTMAVTAATGTPGGSDSRPAC